MCNCSVLPSRAYVCCITPCSERHAKLWSKIKKSNSQLILLSTKRRYSASSIIDIQQMPMWCLLLIYAHNYFVTSSTANGMDSPNIHISYVAIARYWTTKVVLMKILITRINLWNQVFFLTWGDDAVQAHTSRPVPARTIAKMHIY